MNRQKFAPGEWYHCYTRGVDKRETYSCPSDYQRFLEALYLCNSTKPVHRSNLSKKTDIFSLERSEQLVDVAAFCLMPNHFHLLIQEKEDGGISNFMQKLGTSYTMYFNKRYNRVGNLFVKPFRSKHVHDDSYSRQIVPYIHLNPLDLTSPNWIKSTEVQLSKGEEAYLKEYPYSSLFAYTQQNSFREQDKILSLEAVDFFNSYVANQSLGNLVKHAQDFIKVSP